MTPTRRRFLSAAGLLVVAGCGLEDYEAKMLAEQKRLERFDAENKDLGAPLEMPVFPEGTRATPMFLRPPKGVSSRPNDALFKRLLYVYQGSTSPFAGMGLCWAPSGRIPKGELIDVLGRPREGKSEEITTNPDAGRPRITLEITMIFDSNPMYTDLLFVDSDKQVAIVYQVERARLGKATDDVIRSSLNTLVLGDEASRLRGEYNKRLERAK